MVPVVYFDMDHISSLQFAHCLSNVLLYFHFIGEKVQEFWPLQLGFHLLDFQGVTIHFGSLQLSQKEFWFPIPLGSDLESLGVLLNALKVYCPMLSHQL